MVERSDNRGNDPNTGPDVGSLKSEMLDLADMSTSENLKTIADLFETLISEKRFLQASVLLVQSLKLANKPDMQDIGAVSDLRNYLLTQESVSHISNI
jgi:exocyst complex component 4